MSHRLDSWVAIYDFHKITPWSENSRDQSNLNRSVLDLRLDIRLNYLQEVILHCQNWIPLEQNLYSTIDRIHLKETFEKNVLK